MGINTRQLRQLRRNGGFDHIRQANESGLILGIGVLLAGFGLLLAFLMLVSSPAMADVIDHNKLADAIYIAEGGVKTAHPYGILATYKHTTPRQACINTIKSNLKRWNGQGDFISYLGKVYCPAGAKNDPGNLNRNWVKNVGYYYLKLKGEL